MAERLTALMMFFGSVLVLGVAWASWPDKMAAFFVLAVVGLFLMAVFLMYVRAVWHVMFPRRRHNPF